MTHPRHTAVVIATGPSLSDDQVEFVRLAQASEQCVAIAVNNAYERAPWAHALYAGDYLFFKVHAMRMQAIAGGRIWTCDRAAAERWRLHHVKATNRPGLGEKVVHLNGNSGAQAINLAALWGAKRILLIGFDMCEVEGRAHYFGQHQPPLTTKQLFGEWIHKLASVATDAVARGIEIVNCTPGSALRCFPSSSLLEELP